MKIIRKNKLDIIQNPIIILIISLFLMIVSINEIKKGDYTYFDVLIIIAFLIVGCIYFIVERSRKK